jgi:hypothetical protein
MGYVNELNEIRNEVAKFLKKNFPELVVEWQGIHGHGRFWKRYYGILISNQKLGVKYKVKFRKTYR